jgi:hypothetical protein
MRKLTIDRTKNSPEVILDPENRIFMISGESRPPDVWQFYNNIILWLDDFNTSLIESDGIDKAMEFNFNFEYFNSSSAKSILDICKILSGFRKRGIDLKVNWHYEKDDFDMLEVGKEMSNIVKFPFAFVES